MRKAYSNQLRLDAIPSLDVELNLQSRHRLVPVLRSLQHVYSDSPLTDRIPDLIAADINKGTRTDTGRTGMDYWHMPDSRRRVRSQRRETARSSAEEGEETQS